MAFKFHIPAKLWENSVLSAKIQNFAIFHPPKNTKKDTPKVSWRSSAVSSLVLSKALGADQHEALDQRQAHQLCGLGWSGSYAVHRMGCWEVGMLGCWISVALWKMLVDKQLLLCFFLRVRNVAKVKITSPECYVGECSPLSGGTWLIHIKELLKLMRPDRCLALAEAIASLIHWTLDSVIHWFAKSSIQRGCRLVASDEWEELR